MKNRFDVIMFDCDGVLVDSEIISARAHGAFLRSLGLPADDIDIACRYTGVANIAMVPMINEQFGTVLPDDYLVRVKACMTALCEKGLPPIPGVKELLDSLRHQTCIVSNSSVAWIRRALLDAGLTERFDGRIFSAEMVKRGKPAPDLLLHAAATLGVSPARCLVIEDSPTGVTAARAAGMSVLGFHGGAHCHAGTPSALLEAGAAACFPSMAMIAAALSE